MNKESKLNLNASDYAISHFDSNKTYKGSEVHKMLYDAYIAGNNDTLIDKDEEIRKALINVFATHKDYEVFFGVSVEDIHAWLEKQGTPAKLSEEEPKFKREEEVNIKKSMIDFLNTYKKAHGCLFIDRWIEWISEQGTLIEKHTFKDDVQAKGSSRDWTKEDDVIVNNILYIMKQLRNDSHSEDDIAENCIKFLENIKGRVQSCSQHIEDND